MIDFKVMSRRSAKEYSKKIINEKTFIISITDTNMPPNEFYENKNIKGILSLKFDDVEFGEINCITDKDAIDILKFVNSNINDIECLIVHCEAGISRSAGVCAALMLILNGDDKEIFYNPRFCPNQTCYRTLLKNYYGDYDRQAVEEKFKLNIELWKRENDLMNT